MSFSPRLRGRISSPLEAGPSPADGHHLPGHVNEALEYVSKRVGRKGPPITLLVVRRDYQLPTSPIASPTSARGPLHVSTGSTPSRPTFPPTSRIEALKQLIRPNNSGEGQIRERIVHVHLDQLRNGTASPAFSEASTVSSAAESTFSHRVRWPGSPTAYGSVPVTPATPFTVMSSLSGIDENTAVSRFGGQSPNQFGMKLVYAHPLSPREEKNLTQALEKAAKKFKLEPSWLPQAVSPSSVGLPVDLMLKSTAQNEPLFSSERVSLLSLDHLYTFRTALQAYARAKATCRLEDAVDELRRLFLANGRRALRKSALLAAYRWLDPINDDALADVCRMYERAYGGIEKESGVENDIDPPAAWPLSEGERDSVDMEQLLLEKETCTGRRKGAAPPRPEIPIRDLTDAIDKEILLSSADLDLTTSDDDDNASELSEIEAWYREMQLQNDHLPPAVVDMHPLRSHPATTTTTPPPTTTTTTTTTTPAAPTITKTPPLPSSPPPPPPTSATYRNRPWATAQSHEPSLSEMRRTTPKLRPAPPRRALFALKLQTTFDKPAAAGSSSSKNKNKTQQPVVATTQQQQQQQTGGKPQAGVQQNAAAVAAVVEEEDEEEEELTARPHSAIKSFANARWSPTASSSTITTTTTTTATGGVGNGISIDEMLHGGGGGVENNNNTRASHHLRVSAAAAAEERVGPMTPNGYDDISPITRGEWGLLMFGKGRTAGLEMC